MTDLMDQIVGTNGHHDLGEPPPPDDGLEYEPDTPDYEEILDGAIQLNSYVDPTLPIENLAAVIAEVDAAPAPQFLARPIWPGDAHGIIGAENKAGKTWAILDLMIAVATGGSWLGQYPCEQPGGVLVFLGEGGKRKMIRRARAVADHYGVKLDNLPIRICHRVPHLAADSHIAAIRAELEQHPASLVIIDPLYLAAKGAKGSQLFEMATVLEPIQIACQQAGAALVVVHHWNKTGTGKDRDRFSGAGSAEWGRVLASVSVASKTTDPDGGSNVVLEWQFIGDEIPDVTIKLRRQVRADDPDDLASPMHYSVEPVEDDQADAEPWHGPTQCMDAVLHLLTTTGMEMSKNAIRTELRDSGNSYRNETVGQACEQLATDGRLHVRVGPRSARLFSVQKVGDHELI